MAKTYLDIQNSAYTVGNIMDWTNALTRLSGVPVDITSVYDSYAAAVIYAADNAVAYEGQVIAVTENGDSAVYVITPASQGTFTYGDGEDAVSYEVYIKEIGKVIIGDDSSITVNDGVVRIAGFKDASTNMVPQKQIDADGNEYIDWVSLNELATQETYSITKEISEDTVVYKLTKDGEAVGDEIVVPDLSALGETISSVSEAISGHETRIAGIEAFFEGAAEDSAGLNDALDKLVEIQEFLEGEGGTVNTLLGDVTANTQAIALLNGDSDDSIAGKIAAAVNTLETTIESTYATSEDVAALIDPLATKATVNNKVDKTELENYYTQTEVENLVNNLEAELRAVIGDITGDVVNPEDNTISGVNIRLNTIEEKNSEQDERLVALEALASSLEDPNNGIIKIVNDNADIIAKLIGDGDDSIQGLIDQAIDSALEEGLNVPIASKYEAGIVKASDQISVDTDGTMSIKQVSIDTLVQGENALVLNGGSAQ